MDDITKKKLEAGAKMAVGSLRILSGAAMGTGHGLLGAFFKNHNQMHVARFHATNSIKAGGKTFKEGLDDWKRADS